MTECDRQPAAAGFDPPPAWGLVNDPGLRRDDLAAAMLANFDPISLTELSRVALLDRVEVKYVLPLSLLHAEIGRAHV